jgi:hypothetical protein
MLFVLRHRQRSDLSAEAQRAKAEAIHASASGEMDCFVANAPGNDAENACLGFEAVIPGRSAGPNPE